MSSQASNSLSFARLVGVQGWPSLNMKVRVWSPEVHEVVKDQGVSSLKNEDVSKL